MQGTGVYHAGTFGPWPSDCSERFMASSRCSCRKASLLVSCQSSILACQSSTRPSSAHSLQFLAFFSLAVPHRDLTTRALVFGFLPRITPCVRESVAADSPSVDGFEQGNQVHTASARSRALFGRFEDRLSLILGELLAHGVPLKFYLYVVLRHLHAHQWFLRSRTLLLWWRRMLHASHSLALSITYIVKGHDSFVRQSPARPSSGQTGRRSTTRHM